jgi:hypothetical protein
MSVEPSRYLQSSCAVSDSLSGRVVLRFDKCVLLGLKRHGRTRKVLIEPPPAAIGAAFSIVWLVNSRWLPRLPELNQMISASVCPFRSMFRPCMLCSLISPPIAFRLSSRIKDIRPRFSARNSVDIIMD